METKLTVRDIVNRDPEIRGGEAVFAGTRVPIETLIEYLEGDYSIDIFLDHFPTVKREQAIAAVELMRDALLA